MKTAHIIIDTSGSMTQLVLNLKKLAKILKCFGYEKVHVIECDHAVHSNKVVQLKNLPRITNFTRGGSDMTGALKIMKEYKAKIVFIVSDGYVMIPKTKPKFKVIWVSWLESNSLNTAPYGDVLRLYTRGEQHVRP